MVAKCYTKAIKSIKHQLSVYLNICTLIPVDEF